MINRNPDPDNFDYFNDYKDTRAWCVENLPEVITKLDNGFKDYCNKRTLQYLSTFGRYD